MKKILLIIKKNWHYILFILVGLIFHKKFLKNKSSSKLTDLNHKTSEHLKKKNEIDKELKKIKDQKEEAREHIKNSSNKSIFNFIRKHANKPD